jgi:hypothetical protein
LPHAIEWDSIDTLTIRPQNRISAEILSQVKGLSLKRQQVCPEFQLLNDRIARLKKVLDAKSLSVNLEKRRAEKYEDETIQRSIDERMKLLAKDNESFEEVLLDVVAARNAEKEKDHGEMKNLSASIGSGHVDTHLRESLRVMVDFLKI